MVERARKDVAKTMRDTPGDYRVGPTEIYKEIHRPRFRIAMTKRTKLRRYNTHRREKKARSRFLFRLTLPSLVADTNQEPIVRRLGYRGEDLPALPVSTASTVHGLPSLPDDIVTELPAHLRVVFVLQQMEHLAVSGGGVAADCWAEWTTSSPTASDQNGGPFQLPAPGAGEVWPVPHANGIYQAIVAAGCGNTPVFAVDFESRVKEWDGWLGDQVHIGSFSAFDDMTLVPNGFWTFAYTIRAVGSGGGVSDFKFRGVVSVTCSLMETLD